MAQQASQVGGQGQMFRIKADPDDTSQVMLYGQALAASHPA